MIKLLLRLRSGVLRQIETVETFPPRLKLMIASRLKERYSLKCEKCGAFYFSTDKFLEHSQACNPRLFKPRTATGPPSSQPSWMETEP